MNLPVLGVGMGYRDPLRRLKMVTPIGDGPGGGVLVGHAQTNKHPQ